MVQEHPQFVMSYPWLCNTWGFSVYDRTWNIRKQCEQRGCTAVHAFLGAEGHVFFIQTIAQVKINLAVREFGGSLIMIAGQGRLRKPVPEQHPRRVPFPGR